LRKYNENTGFFQQQPASSSSQLQLAGGIQEISPDSKIIQDHFAIQALIRAYQVCIVVSTSDRNKNLHVINLPS
jgi:hypothetical protein